MTTAPDDPRLDQSPEPSNTITTAGISLLYQSHEFIIGRITRVGPAECFFYTYLRAIFWLIMPCSSHVELMPVSAGMDSTGQDALLDRLWRSRLDDSARTRRGVIGDRIWGGRSMVLGTISPQSTLFYVRGSRRDIHLNRSCECLVDKLIVQLMDRVSAARVCHR